MLLEELGIYGWKEQDENLLLASLLTGDPLLLIGAHGSAKTLVANKIAEALGKQFLVYDASKAMFEDVLGYPNVEKLKAGVVEYVPSPVTIWDKELVLIDELNRAIPELQSKWLEIIRSRKIMGFETQVKWVWSAMNPVSYSATQALDEALVGRFALFLYAPDVLRMDEADRIKVASHINGEDAPGLSEWLPEGNGKTVPKESAQAVGEKMSRLLRRAARHFVRLKEEMSTLSEFLAKFADLLMRETNGEIALDGRRLGFIYRNILSARAVQLAKAEMGRMREEGGRMKHESERDSFEESARYVVQASIPVGLNDESVNRDGALHKMEICFDLLSQYFDEGAELDVVDKVYELFTTGDLIRKAQILLTENLTELAATKAWNDLVNGDGDITLLAYTALQVEARRPGTVPQELLEALSGRISGRRLSSECVEDLKDESIEHIEEVEALLERKSDLARLIAYGRVSKLSARLRVTPADIEATQRQIERDIETFESLLNREPAKGGDDHEDIQAVA